MRRDFQGRVECLNFGFHQGESLGIHKGSVNLKPAVCYGSSTEPDADQGYSKSLTFIQNKCRKPEKSELYTAEHAAKNGRTEMGCKYQVSMVTDKGKAKS